MSAKRLKKLAADIADMHSIGKGSGLGYAISKPQGKGLTVLLQTPSRDRRRDSILGPFSCICLEGSFGGRNEGFKG